MKSEQSTHITNSFQTPKKRLPTWLDFIQPFSAIPGKPELIKGGVKLLGDALRGEAHTLQSIGMTAFIGSRPTGGIIQRGFKIRGYGKAETVIDF